jgi:hypothetical protein
MHSLQLVNGFLLGVDFGRKLEYEQVGGWGKVLDCFASDHVDKMRRYPQRYMVLLIDFDKQENRFDLANQVIPDDLKDRVFVLGVWDEPEALQRAGLGSPETIGKALAKDCRENTVTTWGHSLLQHNEDELNRLRTLVRPILFSE